MKKWRTISIIAFCILCFGGMILISIQNDICQLFGILFGGLSFPIGIIALTGQATIVIAEIFVPEGEKSKVKKRQKKKKKIKDITNATD